MNLEFALFVALLSLAWLLLPVIALVIAVDSKKELRRIRHRLDALEAEFGAGKKNVDVIGREAPAPTAMATSTMPAPAAPGIAPAMHTVPALEPIRAIAAAPTLDSARLEQLVGGIWLQNVGSVLLLLGTFFLILWGYTKGKIGPEILVVAGVLLGVLLAWRGDRIARTLRPLGHALLGVGLGVVYITLYQGHFRMNVLSGWATFALLSLLSFLTVDIGLRRTQAVIASLGVVGAFVPLLVASMSGSGFHLSLPALLGYFAVVNVVVFALTALRGWSGLVLMALVLTSMTWVIHTRGAVWSFPIQLGLSTLFTALGMAPVVRFARNPGPVRGIDLAVVAMAPMLLLITTLSYLAARKGVTTGGLLLALSFVNLLTALWVDARRSERDLWRPLTAAATIFLAAALERLLASEYLSLAWCVEGVSLIWLGTAPRAGWIRGLGYGVSLLVLSRLLTTPTSYDPVAGGGIGIFNGAALRDLFCVAAFLAVSDRIGRSRESLSDSERHAPGMLLVATNALIMAWLYREAPYIARWIAALGAPVLTAAQGQAPPVAPTVATVDSTLIVGVAWIVQSGLLVFLASVRRAPVLRHVGYAVAAIGSIPFLVALTEGQYWKAGDPPVLYPAGLLTLLCIAVLMIVAAFLWSRRSELGGNERRSPEVALIAANVALLSWTAREAGHLASVIAPGVAIGSNLDQSNAMLAAGITCAAWILQAGALLTLGWARGSAFVRWTGLGLVGVTLAKFVLFDLQRVDVFWRFVIALGVGAVLLVFSFIYQRRSGVTSRKEQGSLS